MCCSRPWDLIGRHWDWAARGGDSLPIVGGVCGFGPGSCKIFPSICYICMHPWTLDMVGSQVQTPGTPRRPPPQICAGGPRSRAKNL